MTAPGPSDAPPADDGEINTRDDGPGRWRLCLDAPVAVTVEGTAWCRWNQARTSVDDVSGFPASAGNVEYDAWLSFTATVFEVHLTDLDRGGVIANYVPRGGPAAIARRAEHRRGVAPIDLVLIFGEEGAPAGAPPALTGRFRWLCGEPPPPS